jgi:hypothetical protein
VVDVGASAAAKTQQLLQQQQQEGEEETGPPTNFVGAGKHLLKVFLTDGVSQVSWQTRTGETGGERERGGELEWEIEGGIESRWTRESKRQQME